MTVRGNGRGEDCGEDEDHVGPDLEGRRAECRPRRARVIVPMCSAGPDPAGQRARRRPLESLSGCSSNQRQEKHTGE